MSFLKLISSVYLLIFFCACQASSFSLKKNSETHVKTLKSLTEIPPYSIEKLDKLFLNNEINWNNINKVHQFCVAYENEYQEIQLNIINKLITQIKEERTTAGLAFINDETKSSANYGRIESGRRVNGINVTNWSKNTFSTSENFLDSIASRYAKIEDVAVDVFTVFPLEVPSIKSNYRYKKVRLLARLDIRGFSKNSNNRMQDTGNIVFNLNRQPDNSWHVEEIEFQNGETLVAKKPSFKKLDKHLPVKKYLRREAIRRGGYALAVEDFNNDGSLDLYVGNQSTGQFLQGDKDLNFKEIHVGNDSYIEKVKTAAFADFDNDGDSDLLLVSFGSGNLDKDIRILENNGTGQFTKKENSLINYSGNFSGFAMPATIGDFNNDKFIDFYVGFPGKKDFTYLADKNRIREAASKNVSAHGIFYNLHELTFSHADSKSIKDKNKHYEHVFPHSSLATDFDNDGDLDIVVVDDRQNLSPMLVNNGDGTFSNSATKIGVTNNGFGMGVASGDFNNDGFTDFVLTNVDFVASHRLKSSCMALGGFEVWSTQTDGIRLFKGTKSGSFVEVTEQANLNWAGEGSAGVEFIDYDNDGYLDIYVANGVWSSSDRFQDIGSYFVRSEAMLHSSAQYEFDSQTDLSKFMQILIDYKGDFFTGEKSNKAPSLAGHQRNRLFRNNGNGTFTDVAYLEGVDSIADGYVIAKADLNKDGAIDLILRNADQGTDAYSFDPVEVFLNDSRKNKSLVIKLESFSSNRSAIGAKIVVNLNNKKIIRELAGNNGSAQSEKIVHFGLGKFNKADSVHVFWPSGKKSVFKNMSAGRYKIRETDSSTLLSAY